MSFLTPAGVQSIAAPANINLAILPCNDIEITYKKITDAMQASSGGAVERVLLVDRSDEIGTLASTFNRMSEDLGRHKKQLEWLVAARTAQLQSANKQLERENADRIKAEEELRESREQLRHLAAHLQSAREQERTQIAREIHDELGQALTALKIDVHQVRQKLNHDQNDLASKMWAMSKLIDTTVQSVRRISSELRPKLLDDLGLSAAIEWQAQEFQEQCRILLLCAEARFIGLKAQETIDDIPARHALPLPFVRQTPTRNWYSVLQDYPIPADLLVADIALISYRKLQQPIFETGLGETCLKLQPQF